MRTRPSPGLSGRLAPTMLGHDIITHPPSAGKRLSISTPSLEVLAIHQARSVVVAGMQKNIWHLASSGGALPPGARANEMRKNRPSQAYQTVLGIKLSLRIVCALGESALPLVSGLWSLVSGLWSLVSGFWFLGRRPVRYC